MTASWVNLDSTEFAAGQSTDVHDGRADSDEAPSADSDLQTEWFLLRPKQSEPEVRLGLTQSGLVFDGGNLRWEDDHVRTPHLVDLTVLGGTLHLLLAEPQGACRAVSIELVDGKPRVGSRVIPGELFSEKRLLGMCWTHGVDRPQISVLWTRAEASTKPIAGLALGAIDVEEWPLGLTPLLDLPLEETDEKGLDGVEDWWGPIAAVTRTSDQIVATMGLELYGGGAGAVVQWSASQSTEVISRRARTWDGTAGLDRGRATGLGGFVAKSGSKSGRGGRLYSVAPSAGLESAVLCFSEPLLETASIRHPIPDRWTDSKTWRRLSPSTVPSGQSVYVFAEYGAAGAAYAVRGSAGSLLELNCDRRRLVREIR
ncbi:hypothetical protein OAV47_00870 [bacterium]|nr:hypothetical protein [bacterium]